MRKIIIATGVALLALGSGAWAQPPAAAGGPVAARPAAQRAEPFDLTGYWVSIVDEDWRWRMVTAPKGDFGSVPLNNEGFRVANLWDASQDGSCKAYGAGGLMRMPTDVHITWASPNTLKLETDWGEQTRMLYFNRADMPNQAPSLQGSSLATWERPPPLSIGAGPRTGLDLNGNPVLPGAGGARARRGAAPVNRGPNPQGAGDLKVTTNNLTPGWLRRNGVPYGSQTAVTEYYKAFPDPTGQVWFDVFTIVDDPEYLQAPFVTSSDYRQLKDGSSWSPHPCKAIVETASN